MRKGWALLVPSGPKDKSHLFFLLNEGADTDGAVLAPVCSIHPRADTTCLLHPGDHPFIDHESYIDYRQCRTDPFRHLGDCIQSGYFQRKEDASDELIERIAQGVYLSKHVRPRIRGLLKG